MVHRHARSASKGLRSFQIDSFQIKLSDGRMYDARIVAQAMKAWDKKHGRRGTSPNAQQWAKYTLPGTSHRMTSDNVHRVMRMTGRVPAVSERENAFGKLAGYSARNPMESFTEYESKRKARRGAIQELVEAKYRGDRGIKANHQPSRRGMYSARFEGHAPVGFKPPRGWKPHVPKNLR